MHSLQVYFRSCLSPIYIQTVFKTQENELSILRDDRLAFGMGTKFRKFLGIHFALEKKDIRNVVLQGEFHSNALAAFAFCFVISDIRFERFVMREIEIKPVPILFLSGGIHIS